MKRTWICMALIAVMLLTACTPANNTPTEDSNTLDTQAETVTGVVTDAATEATTQPDSTVEANTEATTESEAEEVKTFQNPLLDRSAPDPYVIYHDGYYYGTFTESLGIALYRSKSIETLYKDEKNIVFGLCDQVQGNVWAPELVYYPPNDRWYIYACGTTQGWDFGTMRMFCLESVTSDPFGQYVFKGYTDPDIHAIDQTVFYDEASGMIYTAFSQFTENGQCIMLGVMENPWTISKDVALVRLSVPQYTWEKRGETENKDCRVNEGPIFLEHNGKLSLIYSASGCWSEYYCLGLIEFTGDDFSQDEVMKKVNWKKHSQPIFSAANEVYGVGHCNFFTSPDGTETWISYHGMPTPHAGEDGRYPYVQKISFDKNNLPVCGEPLPRDTVISVPSGEKNTVTESTGEEAMVEEVTVTEPTEEA